MTLIKYKVGDYFIIEDTGVPIHTPTSIIGKIIKVEFSKIRKVIQYHYRVIHTDTDASYLWFNGKECYFEEGSNYHCWSKRITKEKIGVEVL